MEPSEWGGDGGFRWEGVVRVRWGDDGRFRWRGAVRVGWGGAALLLKRNKWRGGERYR